MNLTEKFNKQIAKIEISTIRQFDQEVSSIDGIIKLTLGEPDFNTPTHIKQAAKQALDDNFTHYSGMAGLSDIRQAATYFMKKNYQLTYHPDSEVLVTIGATEAISASLLAILEAGDKVLMPAPIYPGYEPIITLAGATPVYIDTSTNHFVLTPEMIQQALDIHGEQVKAIILNYPSNPTGITYTKNEVKVIAQVLEKYPIFIISDEIYSELTYDSLHTSIATFLPKQTLLINGLSKSHAMTGWRIGFIFGPKEFIQEIIKVHQYLVTAASTISQKAAVRALLEGIDDTKVMRAEYQKRRDFVYEAMTHLGFEVARPSGAFYIFAKIPCGMEQNSMKFCIDVAKKARVAFIPGSAFGQEAEGYVRVSYAADFDLLKEAMQRLGNYIQNGTEKEAVNLDK